MQTTSSTQIDIGGKTYIAREGFASVRYNPFLGSICQDGKSIFTYRNDIGWKLAYPEALPVLLRLGWLKAS